LQCDVPFELRWSDSGVRCDGWNVRGLQRKQWSGDDDAMSIGSGAGMSDDRGVGWTMHAMQSGIHRTLHGRDTHVRYVDRSLRDMQW
jgi:hypothetical protein